jgi:UDP-N-acetylglucosamine transferase subunit ALG13
MNIFVTVGTTAFDSLVKFVDCHAYFDNHDVTIQYGPGKFVPGKRKSMKYSNDIDSYYRNAEVVITHGGAGTIYKLMELSKPTCVVPNLDRYDDHQLDICRHLSSKGHVLYAENLKDVVHCVEQYLESKVKLTPYSKEQFFCSKEVADFLLGR